MATPLNLGAGGGGGSGRGGNGNPGIAGNPGSAAPTAQTYNCVPVSGGSTYPITASGGGYVQITWNPQ
jgi:hypothetical protein